MMVKFIYLFEILAMSKFLITRHLYSILVHNRLDLLDTGILYFLKIIQKIRSNSILKQKTSAFLL